MHLKIFSEVHTFQAAKGIIQGTKKKKKNIKNPPPEFPFLHIFLCIHYIYETQYILCKIIKTVVLYISSSIPSSKLSEREREDGKKKATAIMWDCATDSTHQALLHAQEFKVH